MCCVYIETNRLTTNTNSGYVVGMMIINKWQKVACVKKVCLLNARFLVEILLKLKKSKFGICELVNGMYINKQRRLLRF